MAPTFELARRLPAAGAPTDDQVDAVIVPIASDQFGDDGPSGPLDLGIAGELASLDAAEAAARGFEGKVAQLLTISTPSGSPDVVLAGVGATGSASAVTLRKVGAAIGRQLKGRTAVATSVLDVITETADRPDAAQGLAESIVLAGYSFTAYKSEPAPGPTLARVTLIGAGGARVERALDRGVAVAGGVLVARDLVNTPGGDLTPAALAGAASEIAQQENLQITILDLDDIRAAGLGGLLGVNRGSDLPPRFIELCYEPENPKATVALVGKGITFDSGGLSIKSGEAMMAMKNDMGGAAAVLGAFSAITAIAPKVRVRGYIPATDNMSGGDATRPGDVLKIRNGKTVEVLNTDAEGRLVLADALSLASEAKPDAIVDLATLTGAVEVALGNRIAGVMGNSISWVAQVQEAADRAGERVWPLPLPPDYHERIESDVADLRNIGKGRGAGTITAGLFLQDFVADGIPWAHLDIAAVAWSDVNAGENAIGGTGWGVRTILELVSTFKKPR